MQLEWYKIIKCEVVQFIRSNFDRDGTVEVSVGNLAGINKYLIGSRVWSSYIRIN
jgi:hypothetical protein